MTSEELSQLKSVVLNGGSLSAQVSIQLIDELISYADRTDGPAPKELQNVRSKRSSTSS